MAQCQRRHSSFILDALMVVEMKVSVNQIIRFLECLRFVSVDALRFQNGKEMFCHCVVIKVTLT